MVTIVNSLRLLMKTNAMKNNTKTKTRDVLIQDESGLDVFTIRIK